MMRSFFLNLFALTLVTVVPVTGQAVPPLTEGIGAKAHAFDISQVVINDSRMKENEASLPTTLAYESP